MRAFSRPLTRYEWQFAAGAAILIWCACSPPRPTPIDFSGEWAGTTSQGRRITFTVSGDLRVTGVTIEFTFASCAGTLPIPANAVLLNPSGAATAVVTYAPNGAAGARTTINFLFPSMTRATGTVQFDDFATCGSANATWTADKQ
jgi:hypothetical protein